MGRRRQQAAKPVSAFLGGLFKKSKAVGSYLFNGAKNVLKPKPVRNSQVFPAMPQMSRIRPVAPRPAVAPQVQPVPQNPNSPAGLMENFLSSVKSGIRRNVQEEFDLNARRVNSPEQERDVERSTSLLPTVGRALKKFMPTFIDGLFDMIAGLVNALLGMFKVKDETKKMVTDAIKPIGRALCSTEPGHTPGQGLATLATAAAPTLVKMLTDFLGVNIAPNVAAAAAAFPQPAYTPAANAMNPAARPAAANPADLLQALAPAAPAPRRRRYNAAQNVY